MNSGFVRANRAPSEYVWMCLTTKLVQFSGRSRRLEYGSIVLFGTIYAGLALIVEIGLLSISNTAGLIGLVVVGPIVIWMLLAGTAATVRRLHDLGHSGWWILLAGVPVAAVVMTFYLIFKDGSPNLNRFGPSPKHFA
ncbi:MAG: DUF805 domain-containing protein [Acidimicrobiales bacterium]